MAMGILVSLYLCTYFVSTLLSMLFLLYTLGNKGNTLVSCPKNGKRRRAANLQTDRQKDNQAFFFLPGQLAYLYYNMCLTGHQV